MAGSVRAADLAGSWYRSFEEESAGRGPVYRPASYAFPLRRAPRPGLRLEPDGSASTIEPDAGDRPRPGASGRWTVRESRASVRTPNLSAEFTVETTSPLDPTSVGDIVLVVVTDGDPG